VNNASAGGPGAPIIKQIKRPDRQLAPDHHRVPQLAVLRRRLKWDPTASPKQGDPPYSWVAMNILIAFGPVTGKPTTTPTPTARRRPRP
jgi:hypothetical protein